MKNNAIGTNGTFGTNGTNGTIGTGGTNGTMERIFNFLMMWNDWNNLLLVVFQLFMLMALIIVPLSFQGNETERMLKSLNKSFRSTEHPLKTSVPFHMKNGTPKNIALSI